MQRTPLVMQFTTKTLLQRTLITSLLESQLETEQSHQDLQLRSQEQVPHKTLGVKTHKTLTLTLVVIYFMNYKVVKITLV